MSCVGRWKFLCRCLHSLPSLPSPPRQCYSHQLPVQRNKKQRLRSRGRTEHAPGHTGPAPGHTGPQQPQHHNLTKAPPWSTNKPHQACSCSSILCPESAEAHNVVPLLGKHHMREGLTCCTLHHQCITAVEGEELDRRSVGLQGGEQGREQGTWLDPSEDCVCVMAQCLISIEWRLGHLVTAAHNCDAAAAALQLSSRHK